MSRKQKITKAALIITGAVVIITAIYIMANGLGLSENLDFGAGAYYYADIPGFEKFVRNDAYDSRLPLWLAIVLFLAWGFLMYRLWVWIDKRNDKE